MDFINCLILSFLIFFQKKSNCDKISQDNWWHFYNMYIIIFLVHEEENMRSLKTLALQAKERLKGSKGINTYTDNAIVEFKKIEKDEDIAFMEKVERLQDLEDVQNPISYLIDYNYYNSLEEHSKEKYFLDLLDKYRFYKQKLEEQKNKIV